MPPTTLYGNQKQPLTYRIGPTKNTGKDGKCDGVHKGTTTIPPPTRQRMFPGSDPGNVSSFAVSPLANLKLNFSDVNSLVVFYL